MNSKNTILIATGNAHKVDEIRGILPQYSFQSLKDAEIDIEVVEDGSTFEENAKKKAMVIAEVSGGMVLADDSGLVVDALNGSPGIYSARYAGENATDTENNAKLLRVLKGKENRKAHFACTLVLVEKGHVVFSGTGICPGTIQEEPDGSGGFGYDPLFIPEGHNDTFGTLGADIKNTISHRSKALQLLKNFLDAR